MLQRYCSTRFHYWLKMSQLGEAEALENILAASLCKGKLCVLLMRVIPVIQHHLCLSFCAGLSQNFWWYSDRVAYTKEVKLFTQLNIIRFDRRGCRDSASELKVI